jgi:pimeloyl-ACP methyl ester carboxylesterase
MKVKIRRFMKRELWSLLFLIVLANIVAAFHAWKFTHFTEGAVRCTRDEASLSFGEKAKALLTGVSLPRPELRRLPDVPYQTIKLHSNKQIECWLIPTDSSKSKGCVVLCHGYGANKATLLEKAKLFRNMGYHTLLPDFMGAGGSEGTECTVGWKEAGEVRDCVNYLTKTREEHIILFGSSMGAAAIMKAVSEDQLPVEQIVLECPYSTMLRTVENRFAALKVPSFPLARLLVFWGGLENGFDAFSLQPEAYARAIHCPTLLIWGVKDTKVMDDETDAIYHNLAGPKELLRLPEAGHNDYLLRYKGLWIATVDSFLERY